MDIEVDFQLTRISEVLYRVLVVLSIFGERSGGKLHFLLQHMLQQVFAERCTRSILHNVHPYEVVVHQHAESNRFVFLADNLAGVLLAKEMGYSKSNGLKTEKLCIASC